MRVSLKIQDSNEWILPFPSLPYLSRELLMIFVDALAQKDIEPESKQ
jgi:hypothetical protein